MMLRERERGGRERATRESERHTNSGREMERSKESVRVRERHDVR